MTVFGQILSLISQDVTDSLVGYSTFSRSFSFCYTSNPNKYKIEAMTEMPTW